MESDQKSGKKLQADIQSYQITLTLRATDVTASSMKASINSHNHNYPQKGGNPMDNYKCDKYGGYYIRYRRSVPSYGDDSYPRHYPYYPKGYPYYPKYPTQKNY